MELLRVLCARSGNGASAGDSLSVNSLSRKLWIHKTLRSMLRNQPIIAGSQSVCMCIQKNRISTLSLYVT